MSRYIILDNQQLIETIHNGELIKWLCDEYKFDVDLQDQFGQTLLMYACVYGKIELVKFLLLEANAKLDIKTIQGIDAYKLAKMNDRTDIINFLDEYMNNSRNNNYNLFRRLFRI